MSKRELIDRIRDGLSHTDNIRNICVIAHVDHGKSTLTDALVSRAGLISQHRSGTQLFMMTNPEEQKRGITIKSTSVSMVFDVVPPKPKVQPVPGQWTKEQAEASALLREARQGTAPSSVVAPAAPTPAPAQPSEVVESARAESPLNSSVSTDSTPVDSTSVAQPTEETVVAPSEEEKKKTTEAFLVNLIDSPGHVDFSSEVTTALRVCDGALVVVDCVEGVCVQTETVLRQAISERIKPVLFVNKLDRAFLELGWDDETCYQRLSRAIESVNVVIATYKDPIMGDLTVYPQAGTIGFGSGLQGWGFTLRQFAELYHDRFDMSVKKMMKKLWGDNYYDPRSKRWYTTPTGHGGKPLPRAFNALILAPLRQLFSAVLKNQPDVYNAFLTKINVQLSKDNQSKTGKDLLKCIMQIWLPAADSLLDLIIPHLPSPATAQRYRVDSLYSGPMDDEAATAIRKCDPNGPLVLYVSKMVPTTDKRRFYAFGRVFSGTVRTGQSVRIQGPNYYPGGKNDLHVSNIQGVCLMMGPHVESVSTIPAGNMVGLVGVDSYLLKNGTITTLDNAYNFVGMKYSVSPVVRVAVVPENPAHIAKLQQGLQRLVKYDPLLQVNTGDKGEFVVAGCGELHLEVCLRDLREDFLKDVPVRISQPVVPMCETVTIDSDGPSLAKSSNKLNRLYFSASPMGDVLCNAMDAGDLNFDTKDNDIRNAMARKLVEDYKWDSTDAKKIWTVGCAPDAVCNLLVDQTKGVSYLSETKDLIMAGFSQATNSGVYTDEPMRGIRFNLTDAKLHSEKVQRGNAQILPTVKRAMYASVMRGNPSLLEPVYLTTITVARSALAGVYGALRPRRAVMTGLVDEDKSTMCTVQAFLPVAESFGFTTELNKQTGGQAFPQMIFDHWQPIKGSIDDKDSLVYKTVCDIRKRKGLNPELPVLQDYLDRL